GILAVTAAPKFINLKDDALTATLNAVKGSMQSATNLVYGKALIAGVQNAATQTVKVKGTTTAGLVYGYPDETWATTWERLLDIDAIAWVDATTVLTGNKFAVFNGDNTAAAVTIRVAPVSGLTLNAAGGSATLAATAVCYVSYAIEGSATDTSKPPTITVVDC
ncbi:MAG: MSHA pilin protein MshA, partial [Paraglaciecola sp.]